VIADVDVRLALRKVFTPVEFVADEGQLAEDPAPKPEKRIAAIEPNRWPSRKGNTIPGKSRIMNTVNTRPTQILYNRLSTDFIIFKTPLLNYSKTLGTRK
jgi:hypothetical protein